MSTNKSREYLLIRKQERQNFRNESEFQRLNFGPAAGWWLEREPNLRLFLVKKALSNQAGVVMGGLLWHCM